MSELWNKFGELLAVYGPWLSLSLIPSIITGLSLSPKTEAGATWLKNAWNKVKTVLDFLSILTHKDAPGTLQMPLKLNKIMGPKPPAAMLAVIILFGSITGPGCNWFKKTGGEVGDIVVDCGERVISNKAGDLLPTVMDILMAGGSNWKSTLMSLAKQFGTEALACAVQLAEDRFKGNAEVNGAGSNNPDFLALTRAKQYSAENKWVYKE